MVYSHEFDLIIPNLGPKWVAALYHLLQMKTLWFKVDNGPADEVEVRNAKNIKQLKNEIIQQHSNFFSGQSDPLLWNLYKSAQAKEPEDSGDSLDVLGDAGKTSRTAFVLKRISHTTTAPAGLIASDFRCFSLLASHRLNFRI